LAGKKTRPQAARFGRKEDAAASRTLWQEEDAAASRTLHREI
jgi:hypothetical protein